MEIYLDNSATTKPYQEVVDKMVLALTTQYGNPSSIYKKGIEVEREIKEMSLKPGEKILVLERIRYMDDEPVIIELNKFPESFSFLFGEDLNDTSLFEVLKKHNIILDHSRKTLDIIFASPQEAKALNINKGYPLLRIKSTIHDVENTITNLCQQLCIGDKFTFIV